MYIERLARLLFFSPLLPIHSASFYPIHFTLLNINTHTYAILFCCWCARERKRDERERQGLRKRHAKDTERARDEERERSRWREMTQFTPSNEWRTFRPIKVPAEKSWVLGSCPPAVKVNRPCHRPDWRDEGMEGERTREWQKMRERENEGRGDLWYNIKQPMPCCKISHVQLFWQASAMLSLSAAKLCCHCRMSVLHFTAIVCINPAPS